MTGGVPTRHLIDAAHRVARLLSSEPRDVERLRASYIHLPSDGAFGETDLKRGEALLVEAGLASTDGTQIHLTVKGALIGPLDQGNGRELILHEFLATVRPTWLEVATANGEICEELMPSEVEANLRGAIADPAQREGLLLALGQKFDQIARSELGAAGERFVVQSCRALLREGGRPDLASKVLHASEISDTLGYDVVAPRLAGDVKRLEVKTMGTVREQPRFYLSRNEYNTGVADPAWRLVLCGRVGVDEFSVVGWCTAEQLAPCIPRETSSGRWESALLEPELTLFQSSHPIANEEVE